MRYDIDFPTTPYVPVRMHEPTYIPDVNVPGMIKPIESQILPAVCAQLENHAGKHAGSSVLRTYSYNALSDRGFRNENFAELVEFTLNYIVYQVEKGVYSEPAAAIQGAAETCLAMWSSEQINRERGLVPHVQRAQLSVAESNALQYNRLIKEFKDMAGYGYQGRNDDRGYGHRDDRDRGYRDDRGYGRDDRRGRDREREQVEADLAYDNRNAPRAWLDIRDEVFSYYDRYREAHRELGHPEDYLRGGRDHWETRGSRFYEEGRRGSQDRDSRDRGHGRQDRGYGRQENNGRQETAPVMTGHSRYLNGGVTKESEYGTSPNSVHHQAASRAEPVNAPQPAVEQVSEGIPMLEMEGGSEMDRSKHQVKATTIPASTAFASRYLDYSKAAEAIAEANPKEMVIENEEGKLVATPEQPQNVVLDPRISLCESLESALLNSRIRMAHGKEDGKITIYRRVIAIARNMPTENDMSSYLDRLSSSANLSELAVRLSSILTASEKVILENPDGDHTEVREVIAYMTMIETQMRDIVMHFLKYVCGNDSVLSSFCTGYPEMVNYFRGEDDNNICKAIDELSDDVMEILRRFTKEDYAALEDYFLDIPSDIQDPKTFKLAMFPVAATLTMVDMTSAELGYKVSDEVAQIDEAKQPALYGICRSALDMKGIHGLRGYYNLLATADNVVYEFFRDVTVRSEIMIRRHHGL